MSVGKLSAEIRSWLLRLPLMAKVMGIAVGMAVFLGGGLFWQIHTPYARLEVEEVADHAEFVAQTLATGAAALLRAGRLPEVQTMLDQMALMIPAANVSIRTLEVRDGAGGVLARASHRAAPGHAGQLIKEKVALPGGVPGSVYVELDSSHIEFEVAWHTHRILATTGIIALLGVAATWWLMGLVIQPIRDLVQNTHAVKEGNYQTRAPVAAEDEVGQLAAAFNSMAATLQKKDALNQHLLRKVIGAGEEERKRVARELHDHTGQALTSLLAGLAALENSAPTAPVIALRAQAEQLLTEVHDLALALRPNALDDLGLVPALERFCRGFGASCGVTVAFGAVGLEAPARLAGEMEVAVYRMVQEALANAARHGQARAVEVLLQRKGSSLMVVIEDNGRGFEVDDWRARCQREDHLGLLGMEERAVLLGGTLRLESRPGAGTHLFVDLPLQELSHE